MLIYTREMIGLSSLDIHNSKTGYAYKVMLDSIQTLDRKICKWIVLNLKLLRKYNIGHLKHAYMKFVILFSYFIVKYMSV